MRGKSKNKKKKEERGSIFGFCLISHLKTEHQGD